MLVVSDAAVSPSGIWALLITSEVEHMPELQKLKWYGIVAKVRFRAK